MSRAFEELFSVPDAFQHIEMPGRTDSWILSDAVAAHGIPCGRRGSRTLSRGLSRAPATRDRAAGPAQGRHARRASAARLLGRRDDVYLALLTGNYEEAARIKLEYFDLWRYFRCGAFGDDAPDRNGLLPKAMARFGSAADRRSRRVTSWSSATRRSTSRAPRPRGRDRSRSRPAVTTSTRLRAAGADVVLQDLTDTLDGPACAGAGVKVRLKTGVDRAPFASDLETERADCRLIADSKRKSAIWNLQLEGA